MQFWGNLKLFALGLMGLSLLSLATAGCGSSSGAAQPAADSNPDSETAMLASLEALYDFDPIDRPIETVKRDSKVPAPRVVATETIRVRIFPRFVSEPHGVDKRTDRIRIRSEKTCRAYRAAPGKMESSGDLISSGKMLSFSLSNVREPVWLECDSNAIVVRESGKKKETEYTGGIYLRKSVRKPRGKAAFQFLEAINVLPIEDYLKGVLPIEMSARWPEEALKAQALAARTYALFHIGAARKRGKEEVPGFDVDDTASYQSYGGITYQQPATNEAVDRTRGETMRYNGKLIQAFYHGDSGGHTEDSENEQGAMLPYCRGKKEVYDPRILERFRKLYWEKTINLSTNGRTPSGVVSYATSMSDRTQSGRAKQVIATFANGSKKRISAAQFRRAYGLRSSLFGVDGDYVKGRGHGHGVGMSQYGALALALGNRWDYKQILKFYYTGISFCRSGDRGC